MEDIGEDKKTKQKESKRERETLFRCAYRNQTSLRQIIDNKAKIIISINTILLSSIIAISGFGIITDHVEPYRFNNLPLVIMILCSLCSAIFAIMAAMPRLIMDQNKHLPAEKQSLIFFGEIVNYTQKEYTEKIEALLTSKKEIYEHMIIDLYNQGLMLKKKYNLLNYSYKAFMYGIVFGVMSYLIFLFID